MRLVTITVPHVRRCTEMQRQRILVGAALGLELTGLIAQSAATLSRDDSTRLAALAERVYTLTRCYNVREGVRRKDDNLPPRFLYESLPDGPGKGKIIGDETLKRMLDEYYDLRGWDRRTGIPTPETIQRLGLQEIIGSLGE